jgi:hypothetical protein
VDSWDWGTVGEKELRKTAEFAGEGEFVNHGQESYHRVLYRRPHPGIALPEASRRNRRVALPRLIRLVEKKRGDRRTGSNLVGSVGEAVFFGVLFLLGVMSLSALITAHVVQPEHHWYAIGVGFWCLVLVLASLVIMGGVGLIRTALRIGFSAERRSALATRATNIDLVRQAVPQAKDYPTLPSHEGLTNSPGVELAYRLPSAHSAGWRLLASTIFALLWNGVAGVLVVLAVRGWLAGRPDFLLLAFLAPFLAVSIASATYLLRQIWIDAGRGQTALEICSHPLFPGQQYQVQLVQHGQLHLKSLELWLVCEEEVTYHQGTDVRRETRVVHQERSFSQANFQVEPGMPFETCCLIAIPSVAMHSFQSEHNAVHWKLVVRGRPAYWPPYERSFPVIVYPGPSTMHAAEIPHKAEVSAQFASDLDVANRTTASGVPA